MEPQIGQLLNSLSQLQTLQQTNLPNSSQDAQCCADVVTHTRRIGNLDGRVSKVESECGQLRVESSVVQGKIEAIGRQVQQLGNVGGSSAPNEAVHGAAVGLTGGAVTKPAPSVKPSSAKPQQPAGLVNIITAPQPGNTNVPQQATIVPNAAATSRTVASQSTNIPNQPSNQQSSNQPPSNQQPSNQPPSNQPQPNQQPHMQTTGVSGMPAAASSTLSPEQRARFALMFNEMDRDRSGALSADELPPSMQTPEARVYDSNHDGQYSLDEIGQAFAQQFNF